MKETKLCEAAIQAATGFMSLPITPKVKYRIYVSEMPKRGGTFIQAESELGSINIAYGSVVQAEMYLFHRHLRALH